MRCACTPEWVGGGCHLGHTVPPCSSISISARAIGSRFVRQNGCERRSRLPSQVLHPEDALDRVCLRYLDGCFRENKQLAGTRPTRSCTDITEHPLTVTFTPSSSRVNSLVSAALRSKRRQIRGDVDPRGEGGGGGGIALSHGQYALTNRVT